MMHLPGYAARAVERLEQAGFETWAVGGCVRDSLRGVRPHDWDLCTAAAPEEMLRYLLDAVLDDESRNRREILLRLARTEMEENYGQHRE